MKAKRSLFLFFVFIFIVSNVYSAQKKYYLKKLWSSERVFKTPESVWYDLKTDSLYISNINGSTSKKDGNGFISKVSLNGKIIALRWAKGLNAPKGICTYKDKLFVTDIDRVAEISLNSGKIIKFYEVKKALFLNDIAVDSSGSVYFSDTSGKNSCVYKLKEGKIEKWLKSDQVKNPNGLFYKNKILYVGSSGDKKIKKFEIGTKRFLGEIYVGSGIDGLIPFNGKGFITSDWRGKTLFVYPEGNILTLLDTCSQKINSADLGFVFSKRLLIIPTFFDNRIIAYKLVDR